MIRLKQSSEEQIIGILKEAEAGAVVGEAPIIEAKKLVRLLRSRGKLPEGDVDMEPFQVLRDIIRDRQFRAVGGPPQLAEVYEHMNTVPFAIYWPDRETGEVSLLSRPLLLHEVPELSLIHI